MLDGRRPVRPSDGAPHRTTVTKKSNEFDSVRSCEFGTRKALAIFSQYPTSYSGRFLQNFSLIHATVDFEANFPKLGQRAIWRRGVVRRAEPEARSCCSWALGPTAAHVLTCESRLAPTAPDERNQGSGGRTYSMRYAPREYAHRANVKPYGIYTRRYQLRLRGAPTTPARC